MEKHVMFKTLLQSTGAVAIGLWMAGMVHAAPMTFEDMVSGPVYLNGNTGPTSYAFVHDITDNGYYPPGGSITEGKVTITFDDDHPSDSSERVKVVIGATTYGPWQIDYNTFELVLMPDALAALTTTGKVGVLAVMTDKRDLNFMKSTLAAIGTSGTLPAPPQALPEPATLVLFGSGLAGVASLGLRRRKPEELS
jgi:hypothetical protein